MDIPAGFLLAAVRNGINRKESAHIVWRQDGFFHRDGIARNGQRPVLIPMVVNGDASTATVFPEGCNGGAQHFERFLGQGLASGLALPIRCIDAILPILWRYGADPLVLQTRHDVTSAHQLGLPVGCTGFAETIQEICDIFVPQLAQTDVAAGVPCCEPCVRFLFRLDLALSTGDLGSERASLAFDLNLDLSAAILFQPDRLVFSFCHVVHLLLWHKERKCDRI